MLLGHGSDAYKYKQNIKADFSSNVWYKGLPKGLRDHLVSKFKNISSYPEPNAEALAIKLAALQAVCAENVLVTNGATEVFYLLAQSFKDAKSTIYVPSFAEYDDACRMNKHTIEYRSNDTIDFDKNLEERSVVWLANPNNPDGKLLDTNTLVDWIKVNSKVTFILDEAYGELCYGFKSMVPYINDLVNLIIVKSLTKAFAIPGLRLGYLVANSEIIDRLLKLKMPWSVNYFAIEAGLFICDSYAKLLPNINEVFAESKNLQQRLLKIPQINVKASTCNFFLLELKHKSAKELKDYLIAKHGLLIRDASNFKELSNRFVRIAVQGEAYNKLLANSISEFYANS